MTKPLPPENKNTTKIKGKENHDGANGNCDAGH